MHIFYITKDNLRAIMKLTLCFLISTELFHWGRQSIEIPPHQFYTDPFPKLEDMLQLKKIFFTENIFLIPNVFDNFI